MADSNSEGRKSPRNKLNDLTGTEWIKFTRSWFIHDNRNKNELKGVIKHPATFPSAMIAEFIRFFTKRGELVLDPLLGTGSTLVACDNTERRGIGIELYDEWANIAKSRTSQQVMTGDCREILSQLIEQEVSVDFIITSPPYLNMMKKITGSRSVQKKRKQSGLPTDYGTNEQDLGIVADPEKFIENLYEIFSKCRELLKNKRYLVVIMQNVRNKGEVIPLAWEFTRKMKDSWLFKGEKIWIQSQKQLNPFGYPFDFVSNVHHHYCLIFRKKTENITRC
ncbi:MAG: DNA methyltransferase [Candidatus Helarchaeota archaeon]